jgi:NADH:ubiquinone oxidoreductase subunit E
MKKVNISICTGAKCNKEQATWMKQFDQILSPSMKSKVRMNCTNCNGNCPVNHDMAPQVKVNGQLFVRATPAEVRTAILAVA